MQGHLLLLLLMLQRQLAHPAFLLLLLLLLPLLLLLLLRGTHLQLLLLKRESQTSLDACAFRVPVRSFTRLQLVRQVLGVQSPTCKETPSYTTIGLVGFTIL